MKKKETTYQKYKRENKELKEMVTKPLADFALTNSIKEFKKRRKYLEECIINYKHKRK